MIDSPNPLEGDGVVTIITVRDHCDMRRWKTKRCGIIMTSLARGNDAAVVKSSAPPGLRSVAIIADIAADDMSGMLTRCAAVVVTKEAFHRSAFELSTNVTAGAIDEVVFTGEWKASCEMVEIFQAFSNCCCVKPSYRNDKERQASRS